MPTVQPKFFDHPIEVDDDEAEALRRGGMLREPAPEPAPAATKPERPAKEGAQ